MPLVVMPRDSGSAKPQKHDIEPLNLRSPAGVELSQVLTATIQGPFNWIWPPEFARHTEIRDVKAL